MPTLSRPGAELHFAERGAGPTLLLLHGLGGSGADWDGVAPALCDRYRVVTPDLRGSGGSQNLARPHGPFSIAELAADTAALLEHLGGGPAHVCGWSMGGMVALQLAVDNPDRVASLTIVNSGPDWTPKTALQGLALHLRGVVTALVGPAAMARVLARKLFPHPGQAALRRAYLARMAENDRRTYAALLAAIVGWSVADRLPSLSMPTLAVASDGDYTPLASRAAWARRMPDARLVVVRDSRHALPLEAPERLVALLANFVDDLTSVKD